MNPSATIVNFAYGSNMLTRRLRERAPSARTIGAGVLHGHTLRWHKVGQDYSSGKCDILETGNDADTVPAARRISIPPTFPSPGTRPSS